MDVKKAEEYIRIMLRDKDIPDGAKTISYVYAREAIETILSELEKKEAVIDEMAEDYSKYQTLRSYPNEITETAFGIKDRIYKKVNSSE